MRRFLLGAFLLLLAAVAIAYAFRTTLTQRLMQSAVARNMAGSLVDELPDGLHVMLCGAGSPLPDPSRSGPCVAVIAGELIYVVDSGTGSSRVLSRTRIPQGAIEAIFLTHFHSDHIDGLGELLMQRWVNGTHTSPTPVYGAEGVQQVVAGFNQAYTPDAGYRVAHHGDKTVPRSGAGAVARPFVQPANGVSEVLIERDGLKITAFRVDHEPIDPAVGYRFDYKGRSVVISGDTKKNKNLQEFSQGADLLVHEALAPHLVGIITDAARQAGRENLVKITEDILNYHTTPVEVAEIARDADVGHLLYYHIVPPLLLAPMQEMFVEGVDAVWDGPYTVGTDGTLISLPAGSDAIELTERL